MLSRWPAVAVWRGTFGAAQAERLLWRAGFGPRPGEAQKLARLGLEGAVHKLTHPGREHLVGHRPHDEKGRPLAPFDAWGHDHVWWLDRMVRTSRPLVERMTLIWHDWFATSNNGVGSQRLMLNQNQLFRHQRPRLIPRPAARRDQGPGDAALAERKRQLEGLAERELRARDDGALHARRRPRLHRGRRPPAGACAHRLPEQLEPEQRAGQLPLRPAVPRSGREDDLPPPRPIHLEGLVPPLRHTSGSRVVLRPEALELLRPRDARPRHAAGARAALQVLEVRGAAGRRRDPAPSCALRQAPGW